MSIETDIVNLQKEIIELNQELREKERKLAELKKSARVQTYNGLSTDEITRYSRQIVMPEIGILGQNKLKQSKVLIVGTGGLGCPAALYLAAAGIGQLTLVDGDGVELSNLHRQVLHTEHDLDVPKVKSAYDKIKRINSNVQCIPLLMHANSATLGEVMQNNHFDVVIDGTDNVATRYLLNDLCVIHKTPLVSGSALQMEGQLTVYNYKGGPCYRCLFPTPPPAETVTSCGDGGVLGVIPGIIGVLQALETLKIIIGLPGVLSGRLLLLDGSQTNFTNVRIRSRNPKCKICGDSPEILGPIDYEEFCGAKAHDKVENIDVLAREENINAVEFSEMLKSKEIVAVDVRPREQFEMCSLEGTINVPYSEIMASKYDETLKNIVESRLDRTVYVICRRGNDSQRAVKYWKQLVADDSVKFFSVRGGLHAYSKLVDSAFPVY